VRLAGENDLERLPARNCGQPVGIVQQEMRSLVAGHAPGEGKDRHGGVEFGPARRSDGGD